MGRIKGYSGCCHHSRWIRSHTSPGIDPSFVPANRLPFAEGQGSTARLIALPPPLSPMHSRERNSMRLRRWNLDDSLADAGNTCILRHEISVPDGGWELVARSIVIRSLEAVGEKCFRNRKGLNLEDSCTLAFGNLIRPHHGRLIWPPIIRMPFACLLKTQQWCNLEQSRDGVPRKGRRPFPLLLRCRRSH